MMMINLKIHFNCNAIIQFPESHNALGSGTRKDADDDKKGNKIMISIKTLEKFKQIFILSHFILFLLKD